MAGVEAEVVKVVDDREIMARGASCRRPASSSTAGS